MKVVPYNEGYDNTLREYCSKIGKFPYPNILSPLVVGRCVVVNNGDYVLGAGLLQLTCEAVVIIDPSLPKHKIGNVLDELFKVGKMKAENMGLDSIHAFIYDQPNFVEVLKNRYGFRDCGKALSLRF